MRIRTKAVALLVCLVAATLSVAQADYPSKASKEERQALDRLASQIEGSIIYTRGGHVRKVTIGDWSEVNLGEGDYVRWGPLGERIAVLNDGKVFVMNADGSDRTTVVDGGVSGGDGCMIEFHTNGREILYGTKRDGLRSVDIASKKDRSMNIPFNTELNISADGRHLVGRKSDCFLVELPGTTVRKFAGGCSPCLSPDGKRMTSNEGGHRTMDIHEWNGKRLFEINAKKMKPDQRWDNMHWSNHNEFIAMQGDGKQDEAYAFHLPTNQGTRLSWDGRTKYPDLFVTKDLKTGRSPMKLTLAWIQANAGAERVAKNKTTNVKEKGTSDQRTDDVRALTGSPTRVVWCQSVDKRGGSSTKGNTRLVGFGSEDGKGERTILSEVSSYAKPIFSPDGERIVYSNRSNNKMYVVNWDGSNRKELGNGYASDIWRDPSDGVFWLYYRAGDGREKAAVFRQQLDQPKIREKIWDHTPTGHKSVPWFRLSADGSRFVDAFPWSKCGVANTGNGKWEQYSKGCWPSMAPDDSYQFFVFCGNHREIGVYDAGRKNYREVDVAGAPGIARKDEMYYPRWSNDVRFLTVTGPRGSEQEDVMLGRFNSDFTKVEKWVQISINDRPDYLGDAWIKSGWLKKLEQQPKLEVARKKLKPELAEPQYDKWPGNERDLVFLWKNSKSTNQIAAAEGESGRLCQVVARGKSVFGRFFDVDLSGGAMLAQDVDAPLIEACKRSDELTIEATITPANITQKGPARIVSFSKDTESSNFMLGQEMDKLVFRLRTSTGNPSQVTLGNVQDGRMIHLVVTYTPGLLTCYIDGAQVFQTDQIRGDFGNWKPMHLVFGDEWDGAHDWGGAMEGVSISARAISAAEVEQKRKLYALQLKGRQPVERVAVEGKLLELTETPAIEDLKAYSRGIVVHSYEVLRVLDGQVDEKKIQVAHWAILDRQLLPEVAQKKIGGVYQLDLEDYEAHRQLHSERSFNDCDDFDIPLFYDVAGRAIPSAPSALASMSPDIHLKVNCAGPRLTDWEGDGKYVVSEKSGAKYGFKRKTDTSQVKKPAPLDVYQTVRHRPHRYNFDVPNGEYLVRLHFSDEHDSHGKTRKMNFEIEGENALKAFNVVAAAGGSSRAIVKEVRVSVSDGNGMQIHGEDPQGGDVFVAGIEVISLK